MLTVAEGQAGGVDGGLLLAGIAALVLVVYLLSLRTHPYAVCPSCKGKLRYRSKIFPWAWRYCRYCNGQPLPRLGNRNRRR